MTDTPIKKSNFSVSLGANQTYSLTGSNDYVALASDDILTLLGSSEHVVAYGAHDFVTLGSNGQSATGAAVDNVRFYQAGSLSEANGSNVALVGSHVHATLGSSDTLSASGAAITFAATGAGDIVNIGGNGVNASNADEDVGTFAAGGAVNLIANSRVDVTGSKVTATLAGDDTFGLYGSGETITGAGATTKSYVWVGQNGQDASGADLDLVTLTHGGTIFELVGSNIDVVGSHIAVTMTSDDTLTLLPITNVNTTSGYDNTITATGAGDVVNVNGSGLYLGPTTETVSFQHGGVLNLSFFAVVAASGDNVEATVGVSVPFQTTGYDTLTLTGSGDTVNFATSPNPESVTLGGNGRNAVGAAIDVANGGPVSVTFNSTVCENLTANNNSDPTTLNGDDTLYLTGASPVLATGAGNTVNLTSNGQTATAEVVTFFTVPFSSLNLYTSGVLNLQANANVHEEAANSTVTLFDHDTLEIGGEPGNVVNIAASNVATDDIVTIDPTGVVINLHSTGVTTVNDLSANTIITGDVVNVSTGAAAAVNASHTAVKLSGYSTATVTGFADTITSATGGAEYSGDVLTVGGNGATKLGGSLAHIDRVSLGAIDTLNVENNSTLALTPYSAVASRQFPSVNLGADDYVSLTGIYALLAPAKTGNDVIVGATAADTLQLTSTFVNSAALLAAATFAAGNAIIRLDATDSITLVGVSQTSFASAVASGHIKA